MVIKQLKLGTLYNKSSMGFKLIMITRIVILAYISNK